MRTLARVLIGIAVFNVWQRIARAHRSPSPVAPTSTRSKRRETPHLCWCCDAAPRHAGNLCRECDDFALRLTAMALANRDASEHVS